jgi:uncharacterized protein YsxB (DUF464 family)
MTEITATKNNKHYKILVENHANSQEVCAAVSGLMYCLEGTLWNQDQAYCHYSKLEPGYAMIECIAGNEFVEEDFRCITIGLLQIREAHPDEVVMIQNIF